MPQGLNPADLQSNPRFMGLPLEQKLSVVSQGVPQVGQLPQEKQLDVLREAGLAKDEDFVGYAQKRSTHQLGKIVEAKAPERSFADKAAGKIVENAPMIGGGIGALGLSAAGPVGAVAGATAGGAFGSAIQQYAKTGKIDLSTESKEGLKQGSWELVGGLAGRGIGKVAKLLGVDESVMKYALHTGEDLERGINPAAAINKYQLKATLTKDLFEKTTQQVSTLNKISDGLIDQSLPYSSTVRPYAVIKGVLDKYRNQAVKTASTQERAAMEDMLQSVEREFNNVQTGAQGVARQQATMGIKGSKLSPAGQEQAFADAYKGVSAKNLPTDKVMTTKEANALKRQWGDTVDWAKTPAEDKMQAVFKAEMEARRDIYNALNQSIADSMGGNEGKVWLSKNKDIQNLMEARSLINKAAQGNTNVGRNIVETLLDMGRKPGLGSQVAAGARGATGVAQQFGSYLPQLGRGAAIGANELLGGENSAIPTGK